jgi:hypothetical protein
LRWFDIASLTEQDFVEEHRVIFKLWEKRDSKDWGYRIFDFGFFRACCPKPLRNIFLDKFFTTSRILSLFFNKNLT